MFAQAGGFEGAYPNLSCGGGAAGRTGRGTKAAASRPCGRPVDQQKLPVAHSSDLWRFL